MAHNSLRFGITLAACIFLVGAADSNGATRYAGDFLMLGAGARALGMGSAFSATSDGAVSAYYNPAGLMGLKSREIDIMHSEQFGGLENYNTFAIASPVSPVETVGIALVHLGVGDIPVTRLWDPSRALGDSNRVEVAYRTDAADYALLLAGAKRINEAFAVGATVKLIRRSLGKDTAFGYGIDLGATYRMTSALTLAGVFRDVTGTTVAWDVKSSAENHTTKDRIDPTLDVGASYSAPLPWFGGVCTVAASMLFLGDSYSEKGIDTMNLGAEYRFRDLVVFRGGSSAGHGSFGLGLTRLPLIASSSLDYAFLSHSDLDSTHRVSMTIRY